MQINWKLPPTIKYVNDFLSSAESLLLAVGFLSALRLYCEKSGTWISVCAYRTCVFPNNKIKWRKINKFIIYINVRERL